MECDDEETDEEGPVEGAALDLLEEVFLELLQDYRYELLEAVGNSLSVDTPLTVVSSLHSRELGEEDTPESDACCNFRERVRDLPLVIRLEKDLDKG